ncbi:TPA: AAA family ATPase [Clostridium botulinum]|nr:AAA family ATPase [Clostridium botulinum]
MSKNKYFINSLYISNFKPFPCKKPPQKIFFSDATNKIIKFMMLSGFNGYGKTSIFQAIEFALSGKIGIFQFKDTTNKYSEHMTINELNKESLVSLELFNQSTKKYISIIRYNNNVQPCKETECKEEFIGFSLYVLHEKFDYNKFIERKSKQEISQIDTGKLAKILEENNIDEWLNTNYIKQEQSSNLLFKSNSERVNFINQFIDKGCEKYFSKFKEEKENLKKDIDEVKDTLEELKINIKNKQAISIGEEPENTTLFKELNVFWDKKKYNLKEDFEQYLQKIDSLSEFVKNNEVYDTTYRINEINKFLNQSDLLKEIIIYSCFEGIINSYIFNYEKKQYLEELITDKNSVLTNKLDLQYLSQELIDRIKALKEKNDSMEKLSDNKQKMYNQTKKFRAYAVTNIDIFDEVFEDTCPLCGHEYNVTKLTLKQAVINHTNVFKECNKILDGSLETLLKDIDIAYNTILKDIKDIIWTIQCEKVIYLYATTIQQDIKKYKKYKERVEFLLEEKIDTYNSFTDLNINNLESIYKKIYIKLANIVQKYNEQLSEVAENIFDESIYQENKTFLPLIRNIDIKDLENRIKIKKQCLQWYLTKKQFDQYSNNQSEFKEKTEKLKRLLIRDAKLEKILQCVKSAKHHYIGDIINYIEIPLYIYSGKLMQTHQNGLGIFCTTGKSKDKVTQFKLTTSGDESAHDILNKFSSGQKAAINMAVMLSFRKIRKSVFDLFMIDDPCQSMDDINVASLTEILRNEFQDTQILISTHEDSTAGYMCYKYNKTGKVCKNFNVQKELYSYEI